MERTKKGRWLWLGVLIALLGLAALWPGGAMAAELGEMAHSKTLTDNGNGTYQLSLSVTGKQIQSESATKADVVIVFDISNSMDEPVSYVKSETGNYYRTPDGQYHRAYRRTTYSWPSGWHYELAEEGYTGTIYSNYGYEISQNERYKATTRMDVAKRATNTMIDQLLAHNAANPGSVRISLVPFDSIAGNATAWSASSEQLHTKVNGYQTPQSGQLGGHRGGTNWEDALQKANHIQPRPDAQKHVIFVSDGNPTFRVSSINGDPDDRYSDVHGHGDDSYYSTHPNYNYDAAEDDAKNIVDGGADFYTVGAFGNVTRMQSLARYAYNSADAKNYYSAADGAALETAFADIVRKITESVGYTDVKITDGLTALTASTLVSGKADGFTYTKNGQPWAEAPPASYDGSRVTWDLGDRKLEQGATYTVSFTVWPSQAAYDLVADLNNGVKTYDSLSDAEQSQIVAASGGGYALKTNTDAAVSYKEITTVTENGQTTTTTSEEKTSDFDQPDPVALTGTTMTVQKEWRGIEASDRPPEIRFKLMRADPDANDPSKPGAYADTGTVLTLKPENNWQAAVHIAPGVQTTENGVLEKGHFYTVSEVTPGDYELTKEVVRPMIIDGSLTLVGDANNSATFTAVNTLKPDLTITKKVENWRFADLNQAYTVQVTIPGAAGRTISCDMKTGGAVTASGEKTFDAGGTAEFSLKKDQSVVLKDLPYSEAAAAYSVRETPVPAYFTVSYEHETGKLDQDRTVTITNTRDAVVVSGIFTAGSPWVLTISLAGLGLAGYVAACRKRAA